MSNGVVKLQLLASTTIMCIADDTALLVVAKCVAQVKINANEAVANVKAWVKETGLQVAEQKILAVRTSERGKVYRIVMHPSRETYYTVIPCPQILRT